MTDTISAGTRTGPIFIVGAPRSGTTLLQYRVRNLRNISLPTGESHFFIPLYRKRAEYGDLSRLSNIKSVLHAMYAQSREFLETDLHGMRFDIESLATEFHESDRHTMAAIIGGLFEKNARGEGKARWGDKTPYYVMHMSKLLDWFPDAQFIHLIRDGRDVALSLFGRQHDFHVYNTYHAAEYWESYIQKGREESRHIPADQYLEIRYEDLLAFPEQTLNTLCNFLGETYTENMLDTTPPPDFSKTPLIHKPLRASNAGKWRTEMTSHQIQAFESVAGQTLLDLGYELNASGPGTPPSLLRKAAYRTHNKLLTHYWKYKKTQNRHQEITEKPGAPRPSRNPNSEKQ